MTDQIFWQAVRYILLMVGTWLVARGMMTEGQATLILNQGPAVIGAVINMVTAAWGFWVKWNTRSVVKQVAEIEALETVSPATGRKKL